LVAVACCAEEIPQPPAVPEPVANRDLPSVEEVRHLISGCVSGCGYTISRNVSRLARLGERAFPAYDTILADPESEPDHVTMACCLIRSVQADRRRFVPIAVRRVTDPGAGISPEALALSLARPRQYYQPRGQTTVPAVIGKCVHMLINTRESVRESAIKLLGEIGDDRDANALVPCLSSDRGEVRHAAADSLAKIGGWRELKAMDAVLKLDDPRRDANEVRHFKKCRDALDTRLKANPIPKYLTN